MELADPARFELTTSAFGGQGSGNFRELLDIKNLFEMPKKQDK